MGIITIFEIPNLYCTFYELKGREGAQFNISCNSHDIKVAMKELELMRRLEEDMSALTEKMVTRENQKL